MHGVVIHNFLKKSSLSNCTEDVDTPLLDFNQFNKSEVKEMLEGSDDEHLTEDQIDMIFEDESFSLIDESVPDSPAISFCFTEENVLAYMAGYLGKRSLVKQNCNACKNILIDEKPVKRKSRDEKLKKNDDESLKQFLKKDEISSYENFATYLTIDNPIVKGYTVIRAESHTCILKLCLNSRPHIEKSLKIANDFMVEMYVGEMTVKQNIYQHLLTKGKLMLWGQFENLMGNLSRSSIDQVNHFELAVHHWKLHMENGVIR
ncbi:hypothetical protein JTE90_018190 [Oedothorax gibbosus]|uniref:Uncharacterized protein n=1 Tax=Oedothorax gibbosus TaxID=931172 RepID=A0AAV6UBF3_9ARAC|nr:hypothetical protein JTE90_018190 [Oedothorax gibbosus]